MAMRSGVVRLAEAGRVASNRQLRRRARHPARHRAMVKDQEANPVVADATPLKYEPTYEPPQVSFNGWSPAPSEPVRTDLPFQVKRTALGQQLPVYRDFRNGRTRVLTQLRRFRGDESELASEMSKVCHGAEVMQRPGRLEVVGDYASDVRKWLVGLGF